MKRASETPLYRCSARGCGEEAKWQVCAGSCKYLCDRHRSVMKDKDGVVAVPLCPEHRAPLKFVCKKCMRKRVCAECLLSGDHKSHEYDNIGVTERDKSTFDRLTRECEELTEQLGGYAVDDIDSGPTAAEIWSEITTKLRGGKRATVDDVALACDAMWTECMMHFGQGCQHLADVLDAAAEVMDNEEVRRLFGFVEMQLRDVRELQAIRNREHKSNAPVVTEWVPTLVTEPVTPTPQMAVEDMFVQENMDFTKHEAVKTEFRSAFKLMSRCGTVFDQTNRTAYEFSAQENKGRDMCVMQFGERSSKSSVLRNIVPFDMEMCPVFDGDKCIYCAGTKRQFGRINTETKTFEMLSDAPNDFSVHVNPFMHNGKFCMFDRNGDQMMFIIGTQTWEWNSTFVCHDQSGDCRYLHHPWDRNKLICISNEHGVQLVYAQTGDELRTFKHGKLRKIQEVVCVRAPRNNFFLMVQCGSCPWKIFSSETDTWTDAKWKGTGSATCSAFFDEKSKTMYYHMRNEMNLRGVTF